METDLRGIGNTGSSSNSNCLKATMPDSARQSQRFQSDSNVNLNLSEDFTIVPTPIDDWNPEKSDIQMGTHDSPPTMHNELWSSGHSPGTSTIDGCLVNLSPRGFSVYEGSDNSDRVSEEDLDLEKSADNALSDWFGISINRLIRPFRIISAFEQTKKQCAVILQDEGYQLQDITEDQESDGAEDVPMDPYDAGDSSGPICAGGISVDKSSGYLSNGKISSIDSSVQSGSSPKSLTKVRGKNKKHRVEGELACPYRKRNPLRFNVRDHEKCANTSYQDMSQLKKHLTSCHFKSPNICPRCHESILRGQYMLNHLLRCPHPLQQSPIIQNADPEDGFGEDIESRLITRGLGKITEWEGLYRALFPNDELIPESSFEPVVENYEMAVEYQRARRALDRDIPEHISGDHLVSLPDNGYRAGFIVFVEKCDRMYERPMRIIEIVQERHSHSSPGTQEFHSPDSEFVHIMAEGNYILNESSQSIGQVDTFNTPQYLTPRNSQGETLRGPIDSSQFVGFSSSSTSQDAMEMFEPRSVEGNNISQIEEPFDSGYFLRADNSYGNIAAPELTPWTYGYHSRGRSSLPLRDTMSLPDNDFPQILNNIEEVEDLWVPGNDYQHQRGFNTRFMQ